VVKCLTLGDSAKDEDLILYFLGEPDLEACFEEGEEIDEVQFEHTYLEKEKGKMVYLIEDEEIENLDVDHTEGTHNILDSADEKACTYHEPLKTKK
ncbi:hypothetical protein KI387_042147, partial [Taxus chinensis]